MKKLKSQGKRVKILDDEPELDGYSLAIIKAAKLCETFSDIVKFAEIHGVVDIVEFVDLVINTRQILNPQFMVKHAKN